MELFNFVEADPILSRIANILQILSALSFVLSILLSIFAKIGGLRILLTAFFMFLLIEAIYWLTTYPLVGYFYPNREVVDREAIIIGSVTLIAAILGVIGGMCYARYYALFDGFVSKFARKLGLKISMIALSVFVLVNLVYWLTTYPLVGYFYPNREVVDREVIIIFWITLTSAILGITGGMCYSLFALPWITNVATSWLIHVMERIRKLVPT